MLEPGVVDVRTVIAAVRVGELDELLLQQAKARDLPKTKRAAERGRQKKAPSIAGRDAQGSGTVQVVKGRY